MEKDLWSLLTALIWWLVTRFSKDSEKPITSKSGGNSFVIDYVLVNKEM